LEITNIVSDLIVTTVAHDASNRQIRVTGYKSAVVTCTYVKTAHVT